MNRPAPQQLEALVDAALEVRERAYAPYSGFRVGAAVLAEGGGIYTGCNVENASYPLSMCAERAAVQRAVAKGAGSLVAVAVVGSGEGIAWPCGGCRQVLHEFADDLLVIAVGADGAREERPLAELLPHPFDRKDLP